MKLKTIYIQNFRSIKEGFIRFNELTAIAGENNAGKTAILRALNSVFNYCFEEKYFLDGTHQYAARTITRITVSFSELPKNCKYSSYVGHDGELHLQFTYNYSKSSAGRRYYADVDGEKVPAEASLIDIIKQDIDFVYIPANRGTKDISWNEGSIFARLVTKYLEDHTKNRDRLSHNVQRAGNRIIEQVLNKLSSDLTNLIIYDDVGRYKFAYKDDIDYTIFLNKIGLDLVDQEDSNEFPVSEYGSGIKSLTVIALHRMLATLNEVSIILGIEEPETNLHPQAQKKLIESFKNSRQSCETQAIFATHSTVIIDSLNHDDVILVRRVKDSRRGFHSDIRQISETFWEDNSIQELKHYSFFRYRNSDFFFSRFVVLTESTTDAQIIKHLLKRDNQDKMHYVSIVSMDGVDKIQYPFFLLKELCIPFCAVVDKDFFVKYKNDELEKSRNPDTCLPEYGTTVEHNKVIDSLFCNPQKRRDLTEALNKSYSAFFDYAKQYGFLPMKYCLEMDLVDCENSREVFFNYFNVPDNQRTNKALLKDRKKAIKDSTNIIKVVELLEPKEYPFSFKRIRKYLSDRIREL